MGRLEDVIARHAERKKLTGRRVVLIGVFVLVVVTILLMQFTNLGLPKPFPSHPPPPKADRVDGIYLGVPRSHPTKPDPAKPDPTRPARPAAP
ncbi:MAG: hypothetical protein ABI467_02810 [Kofleriaceae bacterium]